MHWTNLGLVIVAGLDVALLLAIWLLNPRNRINISFAFVLFFLILWTLGMAFTHEARTIMVAQFWTIIEHLTGLLIPIPFFLFSIYFPYQSFVLQPWHKLLIVVSVAAAVAVVLTPGAWITGIVFNPPWTFRTLSWFGGLYAGFHFFVYFFLTYLTFLKKYVSSEGFARQQLRYVVLGTAITAILGSLYALVIPLFLGYDGPYAWFAPYSALGLVSVLTYFGFFFSRRTM